MRRRDLLVIGGAMAAAMAVPPLLRRRAVDFDFRPLAGFPGFRRIAGGAVSAGPAFLVGLDGPSDPSATPPQGTPCEIFFGAEGWSGPDLPIAVFSDYFCPFCVELESRLVRLADEGAPIRLVWHELPLLGPRSVAAARLALASRRQGAYEPVHRDLMQRALRPGPAGVAALAARHGLDAERLQADAAGAEVTAELDAALGLGRALGLPGTPAMVAGRTLAVGNMERRRLDRLIALERSEPFAGCA